MTYNFFVDEDDTFGFTENGMQQNVIPIFWNIFEQSALILFHRFL